MSSSCRPVIVEGEVARDDVDALEREGVGPVDVSIAIFKCQSRLQSLIMKHPSAPRLGRRFQYEEEELMSLLEDGRPELRMSPSAVTAIRTFSSSSSMIEQLALGAESVEGAKSALSSCMELGRGGLTRAETERRRRPSAIRTKPVRSVGGEGDFTRAGGDQHVKARRLRSFTRPGSTQR